MNAHDGARMSVVEHLTELRRRIIISAIAVSLGAVVAFIFFPVILHWAEAPLKSVLPKEDSKLVIAKPLDGIAIRLKVAAYGGFVLSFPVVLWQTWRFVTPGLHEHEKRYAVPFILSSIVLFAGGGFVAILTLRPALNFLLSIGGSGLRPLLGVNEYLTLIFLMIVAFGVSFEFPLLLVFLLIARVISTAQLKRWRRGAVVLIFLFAAVITPSQDPFSLFAMAIPMYLLYEIALIVGRLMKR